MSFGKRLLKFRTAQDKSSRQMAEEIGVPISTYRDWEYGKLIRGEPYVKIADALGITLDELLRDQPADKAELLVALEKARNGILLALRLAKAAN